MRRLLSLAALLVGPTVALAQVGGDVVVAGPGTDVTVTVGTGIRLATTYNLILPDSTSFSIGNPGTRLEFVGGMQTFRTEDGSAITLPDLYVGGDTLTVGMDLAVTGVLTAAGGTLNPDGHRVALVATFEGGGGSQTTRLAAVDGDGSTLGGPIVFERPHRDGEGWRMIAAPFTAPFTSLNDDFHTQGALGADYPGGGAHLFAYSPAQPVGSRYLAVADYATPMQSGQGYFFYAYGTDPATGGPALPTTWDVSGIEPAAPVAVPLSYAAGIPDAEWNLLGNPYAAPIDWHDVQAAGQFQAAYAIWDPAANSGLGNYAFYSSAGVATGRAGRHIPQAQGFWAATSATSPGTLTFSRSWKRPDSTVVLAGRLAAVQQLRLGLAGEGLASTEPVALFLDGGGVGTDVYDAAWLRPMSTDYAAGFFVREDDGARLVFDGRQTVADGQTLALAVETTRPGRYTLTWPNLAAAPEGPVWLTDLETGAVVDLRQETTYTFSLDAMAVPFAPGAPAEATRPATAPRFQFRFGAVTGTAGEAAPTALALSAPAPNPTRQSTLLRYGLPTSGAVRVVVYDALGRAVATLAEGEQSAGWHTATLDASALAPGVYVVRLEAGTSALTQRLTVVR